MKESLTRVLWDAALTIPVSAFHEVLLISIGDKVCLVLGNASIVFGLIIGLIWRPWSRASTQPSPIPKDASATLKPRDRSRRRAA